MRKTNKTAMALSTFGSVDSVKWPGIPENIQECFLLYNFYFALNLYELNSYALELEIPSCNLPCYIST